MQNIIPTIRPLRQNEFTEASLLIGRVFSEFEAPDYSPEGIETFRAITSPETLKERFCEGMMQIWGAFRNGEMIGVLATRNRAHISLLFVEKAYHRQGIARTLLSYLCEYLHSDPSIFRVTVNSAPYAVEAYQRLGFTATGPECTTDGIRHTPMEYFII